MSNTITFNLDLTDANWATYQDNNLRSLLIVPERINGSWYPRIWISYSQYQYQTMTDCGYNFGTGCDNKAAYWKLMRSTGWYGYHRSRDGFTINPASQGANLPYSVSYPDVTQKLAVNVHVLDDVTIPTDSTFTIQADCDPLDQSDQIVDVLFAADKGLTVATGGTLKIEYNLFSPVINFGCYASFAKGAWTGIKGESGSKLDLRDAYIRDAMIGLDLDNITEGLFYSVVIDSSLRYGMRVNDCSPSSDIFEVSNTGILSGPYPGTNLYVEGSSSPHFRYGGFYTAINNLYSTGLGGHGVEIASVSGEPVFDVCGFENNDICGLYIHDGDGPKLDTCSIEYNGKQYQPNGPIQAAGMHIKSTTFWTTLQDSRVAGNSSFGLYLFGTESADAKLRGWYGSQSSIEPTTSSGLADILSNFPNGLNCIVDNDDNVRGQQYARFDLGTPYPDGQGTMYVLGGENSIWHPYGIQGMMQNYSFGGFEHNWLGGDYSFSADPTSSVDYANYRSSDGRECTSLHKMAANIPGSIARDILTRRLDLARRETAARMNTTTTTVATSAMTSLLETAWPNPFNPSTQIRVTVLEAQNMHLSVVDLLGREVAVLADGMYDVGRHAFTFDAHHLPSGIYHAILRTAQGTTSRNLTLTK